MHNIIYDFFVSLELNWIECFLIVLLLCVSVFGRLLSDFSLNRVKSIINKHNEHKVITIIIDGFQKPITILISISSIYTIMYVILDVTFLNVFTTNLYRSLIIIIIGSSIIKIFSKSSIIFEELLNKINFKIDKILIPFLSRTIQTVTFILIILIVAQEWDYDVQGFIAGLGLGGLALALAAQSSLSNLFAGFAIVLEKPFSIDDWIKTSDVEGVVEDIGIRSTKIRTFEHSLVFVPNSHLANTSIINWSEMGKRRITFNLGLTLNTSQDKISGFLNDCRDYLTHHNEIHDETIIVNFDNLNSSNYGIIFYFFTKSTDWSSYLYTREDVNLGVIQLLEKYNIELAYPTQTLYIDNKQEKTQ